MNNLKCGANFFLNEASISSRPSYFPFSSSFLKKHYRVSNPYVRGGVTGKLPVT